MLGVLWHANMAKIPWVRYMMRDRKRETHIQVCK